MAMRAPLPRLLLGAAARLLVVASAGCGPGCATLPDGCGWGQDATFFPGGERLAAAFWTATRDPLTWAPLAAAAALQVDDWDEQLSDWAVESTPIYGSVASAKDARAVLGDISDATFYLSVLTTPSGPEPGPWAWNKTKGAAVELSAQFLTFSSVDVLKEAVGRTRPDGSNDKSFPSEHAARVTVNSTLASRNIRSTAMPGEARIVLNTGLTALTAAGGWSRVEAGGHYPSDVLAGVAIGRFLGAFIHDAFLGLSAPDTGVEVAYTGEHWVLQAGLPF